MITKFSTCLLFLALLLNSCQQRNQPTSPQYEPEYNSSTTPALIDIEKALNHPAMLKLSQIASKLEYYNVGDARYTVTQAITIPDSDALSHSITHVFIIVSKAFPANDMDLRPWIINGTMG